MKKGAVSKFIKQLCFSDCLKSLSLTQTIRHKPLISFDYRDSYINGALNFLSTWPT
jgi:hypothetical protein